MYGWASEYSFIFPVAGGSNSGIYRYSREFGECPFLAGMDVDQSSLSDRIAGCVIKHIDRLVYEYLDGWRQSGKLPESKVYDLESGFVDWQLSPAFRGQFESLVESRRAEAVECEKERLL